MVSKNPDKKEAYTGGKREESLFQRITYSLGGLKSLTMGGEVNCV